MPKPSKYPAHRNPIAAAILRAKIRKDVASLKNSADMQAWAGDDGARLVNSSGRVLYIVLSDSESCGHKEDEPDIRILRGMGEALGDLAGDGDTERHRPSIQSGLLAIDRLLPGLNDWALGNAAVKLDELLASPQGVWTSDLEAIFRSRTP